MALPGALPGRPVPFGVRIELLRSSYTTKPGVAQRTLGSLPNRRDTLKALHNVTRALYNAFGVTVIAVVVTQGALRDPGLCCLTPSAYLMAAVALREAPDPIEQ